MLGQGQELEAKMQPLKPAERPTFYFIGVTTKQSSIMRIFPEWAKALGLGDVTIEGIDLPLDAETQAYREVVSFLKGDPLSRGALVTTHKLNLFAACRDLFDCVDPLAALMRETSCLSKRDGKFLASAKDPITAGLAIDAFAAPGYFRSRQADVFCMGAGGSGIAITWHLMRRERGGDIPLRIVTSDRDAVRLEELRRIHREVGSDSSLEYVEVEDAGANDAILAALRPGSVVINATGLGKDRPGSPLTDAARFPERGVVWELNYRGDLIFLEQARAQAAARNLTLVDGWTYFLHGWTRVIAEVFNVEIPTAGPGFERLSEIAIAVSGPRPSR
jgi:shikimate 5-dehydrogenase